MPRRTFIALVPPVEWIEALHSAARSAFDGDRDVRLVRPENLHLTLVFLGDLEAEVANGLAEWLAPAIARVRRPLLRVASPGRIERIGRSNALVASIVDEAEGALIQLANEVHERLRSAGVSLDRAAPLTHPHVTLARLRDRRATKTSTFDETRLAPWSASEVRVVFSELRPEGAIYADGGRIAIGSPSAGV